MTRRAGLGLALAALTLSVTACGIPVDHEPHAVQPPPGPFQGLTTSAPGRAPRTAPPSSTATGSDSTVETLCFTRANGLITVQRRTSEEPSPQRLVDDVIAGPTDPERSAGIGTALSGAGVIDSVTVNQGQAVVSLGPALAAAGRNDQFLAFGQIVCTLDARADVNSVVFTLDGQVVAVPRGNGSLTKGPLTTADYESLLRTN